MLSLDSLVIDLIFEADATLAPETLVAALGGEEVVGARLLIDPDQQPPEFEMQVAPSVPMRRRGERRLLVIDDSVAPMRADPQTDPLVPVDLRPEKERLLAACEALPVRVGRLFALGTWGDAVLVARAARDLRAVSLLSWALDPQIDIDGRRRASPLSEHEVKEKLFAFDKRVDELDQAAILADLGPASFERRGELLVLSALEGDGTWDVRNSEQIEAALAAIDRFSVIPGAPASAPAEEPTVRGAASASEPASPASEPPEPDAAGIAPVRIDELGERLLVWFPRERFNLDTAAALGTGAWDEVLTPTDAVPPELRDRLQVEGAGFVAPLEFLSEVFVEGKPLSKPTFDQAAVAIRSDARGLEVHCPRYGPALLIELAEGGRYLTSEVERVEAIVERLR